MNRDDLEKLLRGEDCNLEAKAAAGGLPKSIWETYCAFANTDGGVIVLGAVEQSDKSIRIDGVRNVHGLIKAFWDTVNNRSKVSLNILRERDVVVENDGLRQFITIRVPRADISDRPIFLNGDILHGTYRRNGEGDYRCGQEEVRAMLRDADVRPQDLKPVKGMGPENLNSDTVRKFRNRMRSCRPGHVWLDLDDDDFLMRIGALGRDEDGGIRPTGAGLLMFGNEYDIVREFPHYFLDYQERFGDDARWSDRLVSSSGEWSGNVYDFYFAVCNKIALTLKVPFKMDGQVRIDDTPVHKAVREAMVNAVANANFHLPRGVVVVRDRETLVLSNPGGFRVPVKVAITGGVSDPRNVTILKMFTLIDIGERSGSGMPSIERVCKTEFHAEIIIKEENNPERSVVILPMPSDTFEKSATKIGDKNRRQKSATKIGNNNVTDSRISAMRKRAVVDFLAKNGESTAFLIGEGIGLRGSRVRQLLGELAVEGIVVLNGGNRNRTYRLINGSA